MFNVLVADDEPQVRVALSQIINIIGNHNEFHVNGHAANGREALELLQKNRFDIVLSDISMPVMSGVELASVLVSEYPQIVTVFLSGYSDFSLAQQSMHYRVFEYVLKPVDQDELLSVLRRASEEVLKRRMSEMSNQLAMLCRNGGLQRIREQINQRSFAVAVGLARKEEVNASVMALYDSLIEEGRPAEEQHLIAYWLIYLVMDAYPELFGGNVDLDAMEAELIRCRTTKDLRDAMSRYILSAVGRLVQQARQPTPLDNIKAYICREYASVVSLQTLADRFDLSSSYISELFKADGQNFLDYLTEKRLEAAVEMMRDPALRLRQIAEAVGYNDANYFNKLFKKHVGISPGEFRSKVLDSREQGSKRSDRE